MCVSVCVMPADVKSLGVVCFYLADNAEPDELMMPLQHSTFTTGVTSGMSHLSYGLFNVGALTAALCREYYCCS